MHIPSQVRCVLFDAVGTLIYADPPVSKVYRLAAHDFGLKIDEALIERRFQLAFAEHYACRHGDPDYTTSHDRQRECWRAIVADVFPEIGAHQALFQRLWDHFSRTASWQLYEDAADCWQRLKSASFRVGLASNFDDRLFGICSGLPPLDRCDHIFTSSQLGWRKPALQFFRAIEAATALKPDELMLVGDDCDSDYRGATGAGWHAIYLNRDAERAADPTEVSSLAHIF